MEIPMADSNLTTQKQQVFDYVNAFLGGGMIDVELDPVHYETALTKALSKYRQRNENSVEESYVTIKLEQDQNTYTLPQEIIEATGYYRSLFRYRSGASQLRHYRAGHDFAPYRVKARRFAGLHRRGGGYFEVQRATP